MCRYFRVIVHSKVEDAPTSDGGMELNEIVKEAWLLYYEDDRYV